ncbi:transposase family protein [Escherichia coli DEC6E]|nr:transposase family protein [Escherichia coli DEC6E]
MDKPTDWRSGTRRIFSNEFKLHMVELASKPNANVAQLAREHGVDNNLIFKWLRLWQREGRISRRMPPTIVGPTVSQSFPASPTLVPVELIDTPRCATDAPAPVTCLSSVADGETRLKSCGLMLMVCACSPNALRKVSLSGLRCVTVRYPLPARNWQCSSISWTGVSQKHPALTH